MYLLDTNIIIYYLKGDPLVVNYLNNLLIKNYLFYISVISETELFSFEKLTKEEEDEIKKVLETLYILPIDSQIARLAGFLKRSFKIGLADSLIGATALIYKLNLITRNVRDFKKIPGLSITSI
ncbi:MAG: motility twitching protein PilT [Candidatus Parcubacteria bacterium]|nr:MAG: motility twitching protein PilT [Candidatus Parcubacteria bacterium]